MFLSKQVRPDNIDAPLDCQTDSGFEQHTLPGKLMLIMTKQMNGEIEAIVINENLIPLPRRQS